MAERKILIPDGDSVLPHPNGVCFEALARRNEILLEEDRKFGRTPFGRVSRREDLGGCLIEIIPRENRK